MYKYPFTNHYTCDIHYFIKVTDAEKEDKKQ